MNRTSRSSLLIFLAVVTSGYAAPKSASTPDWRERSNRMAENRLSAALLDSQTSDHTSASREADSSLLLAEFGDSQKLSLADASAVPEQAGSPSSMPATDSVQTVDSSRSACVERGPLPTLGASLKRDFKEMPRTLWHDSKKAFGDPWNLAFLASLGGASIAIRTTGADDHVDEHFQHHHAYSGDWPDTFGVLGNPATHFALASIWYLAGQELQQPKTYEVGRKMFNALAITGISTMFLKVCAWDDSPNGEWGAWPSGHVSSTMAVATVLNDAYGPIVGVPMFGLTALVGIERMDDREHWLSDVVFGAALGWVVAETVMKEHRPEIFGGEIVPYVHPTGGAGIGWYKELGVDKHPLKPVPSNQGPYASK